MSVCHHFQHVGRANMRMVYAKTGLRRKGSLWWSFDQDSVLNAQLSFVPLYDGRIRLLLDWTGLTGMLCGNNFSLNLHDNDIPSVS